MSDLYKNPEYLAKMERLNAMHIDACNQCHDYAIANGGKSNGELVTAKLYIEDQMAMAKRKEQDRYWTLKNQHQLKGLKT